MPRLKLLLFAAIVVFHSCGGNKKARPDQAVAKDNSPVAHDDNRYKNHREALEKVTPISANELVELVPVELRGATRTSSKVRPLNGTTIAEADYEVSGQPEISLEIIDCAGPAGAGVYEMKFYRLLDRDKDDEGLTIRTISLNGRPTLEQCIQSNDYCCITWFAENRYLVSLSSGNNTLEILKQVSRAIKL
jgi:hypothetical protein